MPAQESTRGSLLDRTAAVCRAHGRDDLLTRVGSARRRLEDPTVRVLVVGEFKQGKSQLIAVQSQNIHAIEKVIS